MKVKIIVQAGNFMTVFVARIDGVDLSAIDFSVVIGPILSECTSLYVDVSGA
jgi:hypothetical protein